MTSRFEPNARRVRALGTRLAADLLACLGFYTRLPVPSLGGGAAAPGLPGLAHALRVAPLAGAVIGGLGGAALALAVSLALSPSLAAALALLTVVVVGGTLHEDGLADVADGFGGGRTRERKLAIMRDSRIGTYGAVALVFSLLLRWSALASLLETTGLGGTVAALVGVGAVSRGFGLLPLIRLAPARPDGLGRSVGPIRDGTAACALLLAGLIGVAAPAAGRLGWNSAVTALALALAAAWGLTELARRQVGGHTGDVAGAAQQVCEIAYLVGLLMAPRLG